MSKLVRVVVDPTVLLGALLDPAGECGTLLGMISDRAVELVLDESVRASLASALEDSSAQQEGAWDSQDAQRWMSALEILASYEEDSIDAPGEAPSSTPELDEQPSEIRDVERVESNLASEVPGPDRNFFELALRTGAAIVSIDPDTLACSGAYGVDVLRPGTVNEVVRAQGSSG